MTRLLLLAAALVVVLAAAGVGAGATWDVYPGAGTPIQTTIIDPLDEIYDINESNNESVKEITLDYPDMTIGTAYVPGGGDNAVVTIREGGGICGASNVTVRFESYEIEECTEFIQRLDSIYHPGAANMQVHFKHLYALDGYVKVGDSLSAREAPIKEYSGVELWNVWSPWVGEDRVYIVCGGSGSCAEIDKYRGGNVSDEQIDLPAGGSERVGIPWAYECPRNVHVTVDPDNNIAELDEDNNNETVLMYADLRAERIEFVSPWDTMLQQFSF